MTKPCPNCGNEINEAAIGCPACGAKWSEDGTYQGVPESIANAPAVDTSAQRVGDMSTEQLQTSIFLSVLAALIVFAVLQFALGLLFLACVGDSGDF